MAAEEEPVRESTEAGTESQPVSPQAAEPVYRGPLEITDVRISLRNEERLKAIVSLTLNHAEVVEGLKVIQGGSGLFVSLPARKRPGPHPAISEPVTDPALRRYLAETVLAAYERERARAGRV